MDPVQPLSQELMQIIIPAATAAVSILTSFLLAYLSKYLRSKTQNETILHAFDSASIITNDVVAAINQSVKKAGEDGKITQEEAQRIKQEAMIALREQLPTKVQETLTQAVGDLQSFLDTKIEAAVFAQKQRK